MDNVQEVNNCIILLEKLKAAQILKKLPIYYGTYTLVEV
jgi:hypothetical protein